MTNKVSVRQFITPLLISAALVCVVVPVLLPIISQQPKVYEDIIVGWGTGQNLNRSGELRLLWCLLAVSMGIVVCWNYIYCKKQICNNEKKCAWNDMIAFLLLWPCFARFLFFSAIDEHVLLLAALAMTLAACKLLTYRNILLMVVVYFAILGATAATMPLITTASPRIQTRLIFLTIFIFAVILSTDHYMYKKTTWMATLALQSLIPLILLYFLHDQYNLNGKLTKIPFDRGYTYMVKFGIAVALLHSLYSAYAIFRSNRRSIPSLETLILPTTVLAIFVFNSVDIPMPRLHDWHHAAETFVPFQQVFDFGKTLYYDHLSASGCYPMLYGFVQRFLLNNTIASFYQAFTLIQIASCAAGIILMIHVFGKKCALFIALSFIVAHVSLTTARIPLLLPFLMILMVPRIIDNRHLWLQIYIVCSMLLGLHYPLYGGAYLLGALPFAIIQARTLFSSRPHSWQKHHICAWSLVVIMVLICSPLLMRLARYTLMMSSQTVFANAINIFDHEAPRNFLAWIYSNTIRKILYFCVVYYSQIFCAILALSLSVYYIAFRKNNNKYIEVSFFAFSFATIMLPVIYTYTWLTMNYNSYIMRTANPFSVISIVLFGSLWRYGSAILTRKAIFVCFSCLLTVNYLFIARPQPHAEKLFRAPMLNAAWQVAPHDIQERFPRLGSVILQKSDINRMNRTQALLEKTHGMSAPFLDLSDGQMSYFLFDKEASVTGTTILYRSTTAQENIIRIMERNLPICCRIDSITHYVIYRWMLGNNYVISNGIAVPSGIFGNMPPVTTSDYSIFYGSNDIRNRANAWGKSISSLMPQFIEHQASMQAKTKQEKKSTTITLEFEKNIDGEEADFIFVDLTDDNRPKPPQGFKNFLKNYYEIDNRQYRYTSYSKFSPPRLRVRASWAGEDGVFEKKKTMEMAFGNGKLLMPLGANPWYLTEGAKTLKLEIYGGIAEGESFSLNEIKLLQFKPTAEYSVPPPLPKATTEARAESE